MSSISKGSDINAAISPPKFTHEDMDQSLAARFEKMVRLFPEHPAVIYHDQILSYRQLNNRANLLAYEIIQQKVSADRPVSFLLSDRISQVAAILGIIKSGHMYVPLDWNLPDKRLRHLLIHSFSGILITEQNGSHLAEGIQNTDLKILDYDRSNKDEESDNLVINSKPGDIACIYYTSGSTGEPKGVMLSHRSLLHSVKGVVEDYGISENDRFGLLFSPAFAASTTLVFGALLNGGALCLYDLKQDGFQGLADWINENEITYYSSVPSTFRRFVATLSDDSGFPSLRLIVLGGEPVYRRDFEHYKQHFSRNCKFSVRLASTETHRICSLIIDHSTEIAGHFMPVGYPVKDKELFLLDGDGIAVPAGEVAEICVKSKYLANGYWHEPELTDRTFVRDKNDDRLKLYRTGDLGRMQPDGCLIHIGRKGSMVKIRGHRVELREVEKHLLDLSSVREAVVAAKKDAAGENHLVAYFVPAARSTPESDTLRLMLSQSLPDYMLPSFFISLQTLPVNTNGKIDRQALPFPDSLRPPLSVSFYPPRTILELQLQQVFQEILGVQPVGREDNFFSLGGDSLKGVELVVRVGNLVEKTLPDSMLVEAQTISSIASYLHKLQEGNTRETLVPLQAGSHQEALFLVPGIEGNTLTLYNLSKEIGNGRPVISFQDPRLLNSHAGYLSIPELAGIYVKEVQRSQPQGKVHVGGYSFGCLIAFEMAQQLNTMGREIAPVLFIDMPADNPQLFEKLLRLHVGKMLCRYSVWQSVLKLYHSFYPRQKITDSKAGTDNQSDLNIREFQYKARDSYRPKKFPGRIVFFQTEKNALTPLLWKHLTTGQNETVKLPGDHHSIMHEPHADELARVMILHLS